MYLWYNARHYFCSSSRPFWKRRLRYSDPASPTLRTGEACLLRGMFIDARYGFRDKCIISVSALNKQIVAGRATRIG